jgi:hypothetical protein
MYGPVPVEVAFFADGGSAWQGGVTPSFAATHNGIGSAGVSLRVNLFGYTVGQFDIVHPFQRPGHGVVYEFSLSPGF